MRFCKYVQTKPKACASLRGVSFEAIAESLREAIANAIPDADIDVSIGTPGHYSLVVTSEVFAGKRLLDQQRLVYQAIASLMHGNQAPVHAIDSLRTIERKSA